MKLTVLAFPTLPDSFMKGAGGDRRGREPQPEGRSSQRADTSTQEIVLFWRGWRGAEEKVNSKKGRGPTGKYGIF